MGPSLNLRSRRRQVLAMGLVACAHLLVFLAIGRRVPWAPELSFGPQDPPMQVTLLRPPRLAQPTGARASGRQASSEPNTSTAVAAPSVLTQPAPAEPPPAPAIVAADRPQDCEVQDLPLLTEAERRLCRNQIDADQARRAARGANDKAARDVARAQGSPPLYRMDADKEASFAPAVPHTYALPRVGPGIACHNATFPLLSGVDTNPDIFEKKHKQEHKPTYGLAKCSFP